MMEGTSAPWLLQYLHVYTHNFHLLFLEQSTTGASREARGIAASRAQLGFHDWEAGPDYAQLCEGGGGGGVVIFFVFFSSRPSQGFWQRAGRKRGLRGSVQAGSWKEASPGWDQALWASNPPFSKSNWTGPNSLMNFRYITKWNSGFKCGSWW